MEINADFKQRVVIHADQVEWRDSPMPGVSRKMFDRIGGEVARATSFVRYAAESHFPSHVHNGGEEFIVLEGVFQDELGDHPAGSYIRNPPTSKHTPESKEGCLIFVKLWQFDLSDRTEISCNIDEVKAEIIDGPSGIKTLPLHQDTREEVRVEVWPPFTTVTLDTTGGAEVLILGGSAAQEGDQLLKYSWLRLPIDANGQLIAGHEGARVWIKTGHLKYVKAPNSKR